MIKLEDALSELCEQVRKIAEAVEDIERRSNPEGPGVGKSADVAAAVRALALQVNSGIEIDSGEM